MAKVKRVVIVPSRVVASEDVRIPQEEGLSVYYNRFGYENFFGCLGTLFGGGSDDEVQQEYSRYLANKNYDIHRDLIERLHRSLILEMQVDVVDVDEILEYYSKHSVIKNRNGQVIRRLPNYKGMAEHFGADTVLDVRIWEWGIWRDPTQTEASMKLDCEYKMIAFPENRIIFDKRFTSLEAGKEGRPLEEFARDEGEVLVNESKESCNVVHSKVNELLIEPK